MKRLSKSKLSDNSILRIFSHEDSEEYLGIIEYPDGRLSWVIEYDEDTLKSLMHARLPEEYVFSIVQKPGDEMQIWIMPKFVTDLDLRNIPTKYDRSVLELEPMWNTPWFKPLYDKYLKHRHEAVFTSNDENRTIQDMKQILENAGLIYDVDLEANDLKDLNLSPEHGASYKKPSKKM